MPGFKPGPHSSRRSLTLVSFYACIPNFSSFFRITGRRQNFTTNNSFLFGSCLLRQILVTRASITRALAMKIGGRSHEYTLAMSESYHADATPGSTRNSSIDSSPASDDHPVSTSPVSSSIDSDTEVDDNMSCSDSKRVPPMSCLEGQYSDSNLEVSSERPYIQCEMDPGL